MEKSAYLNNPYTIVTTPLYQSIIYPKMHYVVNIVLGFKRPFENL